MNLRKSQKPRIRLEDGRYYAIGGSGPKRLRNHLLYCAIGFCNRLNAKRKKQ